MCLIPFFIQTAPIILFVADSLRGIQYLFTGLSGLPASFNIFHFINFSLVLRDSELEELIAIFQYFTRCFFYKQSSHLCQKFHNFLYPSGWKFLESDFLHILRDDVVKEKTKG